MSLVPDGKSHLYATTFVIAVVWIVLDQASKTWVVRQLDGQPLTGQLLGDYGWWRMRAIGNPGAAFSLPIELPVLFVGVAILVTILVLRALPDTESPVLASAYGLVVGGAFGNAIDRIFRGGEVVDMIDLEFPPLSDFPVFNVADIGITVGAAMVAVLMIQQDRKAAAAADAAVIEPLEESPLTAADVGEAENGTDDEGVSETGHADVDDGETPGGGSPAPIVPPPA